MRSHPAGFRNLIKYGGWDNAERSAHRSEKYTAGSDNDHASCPVSGLVCVRSPVSSERVGGVYVVEVEKKERRNGRNVQAILRDRHVKVQVGRFPSQLNRDTA